MRSTFQTVWFLPPDARVHYSSTRTLRKIDVLTKITDEDLSGELNKESNKSSLVVETSFGNIALPHGWSIHQYPTSENGPASLSIR